MDTHNYANADNVHEHQVRSYIQHHYDFDFTLNILGNYRLPIGRFKNLSICSPLMY